MTPDPRRLEAATTLADTDLELDSDTVVVIGHSSMSQQPESASAAVLTPLVPASMAHGASSSWAPGSGSGKEYSRLHDFDPPAARIFTLKTAARAFNRYWAPFLLIWLIGSAGLMFLAYAKIKPTYQTVGVIGVTAPNLSHRDKSDRDEEILIETEASLVADPSVLQLALVDKPQLKNLEILRSYPNVQDEISKLLKVNRRPGTSVIQVGMFTPRPDEAAEIINAVVNAFIKKHDEWTPNRNKKVIDELRRLVEQARTRLKDKNEAAKAVAAKLRDQGVPIDDDLSDNPETKAASETLAALDWITPEFHQRLKEQWRQTDLEVKSTEARIKAMESRRAAKPVYDAEADKDADLIEDLAMSDPVLAKDADRLSQLTDFIEQSRKRSRLKNDPVVRKYEDQLRSLTEAFNRKAASALKRYQVGKIRTANDALRDQLETDRIRLEALQNAAKALEEQIRVAKVQKPNHNEEILLELETARFEMHMAQKSFETLSQSYEEASNEAISPAPIQFLSKATPDGNRPTDHRQKILAAIPLGWGFASFFLFLLLEARAGRVTDAEDVPERLRLPVIGIVPPIPDLRETRRRSLRRRIRSQRDIDLFVQCLDHLRVVICSTGAGAAGPWRQSGSHRRCILITSAVGGEGKTTLAAQLAGRCANAGLSTLLIDADLRNPSLSWRLDASEGPGLVDALMGQIDAEATLRLIEDGGGFQLLPAGAPQSDPSRLLQGERLGQLITRFRSMFDVVIIDAPPILPVPDGLLIGRWTEGAIMAVRREASRFPLVQNAKQRLHAVGLPVLGVVVNGVRPFNSSYDSQYGYPSRTLVV